MTAQQQLAELMQTSLIATAGPWRWSENGNLVTLESVGEDETPEIAAVYTERDDDLEPINAALIRQAVNFIRDHGPAIAELIEEASRNPEYNGDANRYEISGVYQFRTLNEADTFIRERIRTALRKLTQDPT